MENKYSENYPRFFIYHEIKPTNFRPPELQEGFLIFNVQQGEGEPDMTIVRLFVSFDMGWGQRSNGFKYDSLNGFCVIIGLKSGKVLDFCTKNRKCKKCDFEKKSGTKIAHDCRLNHFGSAKSMEAEGAVQLVARSIILKNGDVQVGVFIGDNDATCMHALEENVEHRIVKQSDLNHTKKGVGNMLYKIKENKNADEDGELTHDVISHLKDSFAVIIKKNKNNIDDMVRDLKNLPFHVFDRHDNCGPFRNFKQDQENYDNSRHLQNEKLFNHIKDLFYKLANSAA